MCVYSVILIQHASAESYLLSNHFGLLILVCLVTITFYMSTIFRFFLCLDCKELFHKLYLNKLIQIMSGNNKNKSLFSISVSFCYSYMLSACMCVSCIYSMSLSVYLSVYCFLHVFLCLSVLSSICVSLRSCAINYLPCKENNRSVAPLTNTR